MVAADPRQRLGRGLASLLGDVIIGQQETQQSKMRQLALDLFDANPFQPRSTFDPEKLKELAASIRARGILQPILARPNAKAMGRFFIVAGERRWRAAAIAGIHNIPAIIQDMTDADSAAAALIENLQREGLNAMEEAEGYNRLIEEFKLTHERLARALGRSRGHITNALRLLNLPPLVQEEVRSGTITFGHARALVGHPDPEATLAIVRDNGLTVRETEALALQRKTNRPPQHAVADEHVSALERQLAETLGFGVRVAARRKGGVSVSLSFADLHQLELWVSSLMTENTGR